MQISEIVFTYACIFLLAVFDVWYRMTAAAVRGSVSELLTWLRQPRGRRVCRGPPPAPAPASRPRFSIGGRGPTLIAMDTNQNPISVPDSDSIMRTCPRRLLAEFVAEWKARGFVQRTKPWTDSMATTVGGSEIASLLGRNPYGKTADVVLSKIALLRGETTWTGGGEGCWWGTLFEDVIGAVVAVDLGSELLGDELCIHGVFPGHRNSPDGYIVARFGLRPGAEELQLVTTAPADQAGPWEPIGPGGAPFLEKILLLEFKCPISRKPEAAIPKQYWPQVQSGLAVSPLAHRGLFVDAFFRKCALADLGPAPGYDVDYYRYDLPRQEAWLTTQGPFAWGLIGVYAPRLTAPLGVRFGWRGKAWAPGDPSSDLPDADASLAAYHLFTQATGSVPDPRAPHDLADLGEAPKALFDWALSLIDRKRFPVRRGAPVFADGRGRASGAGAQLRELAAAAPPDHWLFAVLPWKLFEVHYKFVDREPGFMDRVCPLIADVHRIAAEAVRSPDPTAYVVKHVGPATVPWAPGAPGSRALSSAEVEDVFATIAAAKPAKPAPT